MMMLSMAVGIGVLFYATGGKGPAMLSVLTQPPAKTQPAPGQTAEEFQNATAAAVSQAAEQAGERMVQIQGKWYKYRADNRYVIDGVPTFHVPKKIAPKAEPVRAVAANPQVHVAAPAGTANLEKSQALIKMAGENPMKIYTPEGFKALKDGLDALKSSSAEQNKALEALMKEH